MTISKTLEKNLESSQDKKKAWIFQGISQRLLQCCEQFAFSDGNEEVIQGNKKEVIVVTIVRGSLMKKIVEKKTSVWRMWNKFLKAWLDRFQFWRIFLCLLFQIFFKYLLDVCVPPGLCYLKGSQLIFLPCMNIRSPGEQKFNCLCLTMCACYQKKRISVFRRYFCWPSLVQ